AVGTAAVVGAGCRGEPRGRLARTRGVRRGHPEVLPDVIREADEVVRVLVLVPDIRDVAEGNAVAERQVRVAWIRLRRSTRDKECCRGGERHQGRAEHLLVPTTNGHAPPLVWCDQSDRSPPPRQHPPARR